MITPREIILGFALPLLLIALCTFFSSKKRLRWLASAGFAAAFIISFIGIEGAPSFPPHNVEGWLVYLVALAGILGSIFGISTALLALLAMWLILHPLNHSMTSGQIWTAIPLLAAAITGWWFLIDRLATRPPKLPTPLLLGATTGCAAIILSAPVGPRLANRSAGGRRRTLGAVDRRDSG